MTGCPNASDSRRRESALQRFVPPATLTCGLTLHCCKELVPCQYARYLPSSKTPAFPHMLIPWPPIVNRSFAVLCMVFSRLVLQRIGELKDHRLVPAFLQRWPP